MLNQGADGAICQLPDIYISELVPMITYSELFTFVIMLCAIITLVINILNTKK